MIFWRFVRLLLSKSAVLGFARCYKMSVLPPSFHWWIWRIYKFSNPSRVEQTVQLTTAPLPSNKARTVLSSSCTEIDIPAKAGDIASDDGMGFKTRESKVDIDGEPPGYDMGCQGGCRAVSNNGGEYEKQVMIGGVEILWRGWGVSTMSGREMIGRGVLRRERGGGWVQVKTYQTLEDKKKEWNWGSKKRKLSQTLAVRARWMFELDLALLDVLVSTSFLWGHLLPTKYGIRSTQLHIYISLDIINYIYIKIYIPFFSLFIIYDRCEKRDSDSDTE
jgi:hypothetical protein